MIGYLGPVNSFTYLAAKTFYIASELKAYSNIYDLFEALANEKVEGIVLPLENSIEGSVNLVMDKLVDNNIYINKEIVLDIKMSLISKNNKIDNIDKVISHPHALAQCRKTLKSELGKYKEIQSLSTSNGVKELAKLDDTYAAIASKDTIYGDLNILLDDISDNPGNETRFIFVTRSLNVQGFHNKSSIICSAKNDHSGSLYDILHEFAIRGINLTKIESRPSKLQLGSYYFHIDFEGNIENIKVKETLAILKYKTKFLKLLGSYYKKIKK